MLGKPVFGNLAPIRSVIWRQIMTFSRNLLTCLSYE